jgi:hypothetical protein
MATNTAGTVARDLGIQAIHYIRKDFTYTDLGVAAQAATGGGVVGVLPAGAVVLRLTVATTASFNDTDRDDLDVGYSLGGAELGSAMDINTAVIDAGDIAAADMAPLSADTTVYFAPTTAVAAEDGTTGAGTIIVEYTINEN